VMDLVAYTHVCVRVCVCARVYQTELYT
jgi:hypothetical protein